MSTISAGGSSAATVPAKATISVRRGSLAALRPPAFSSPSARACSSRRATTSSIRLRSASRGRDHRGMVTAALYWLVRRPGNRLGLASGAGGCPVVVSLQGATHPLLRRSVCSVTSAFFSSSAFYVIFAFPDGRLPARLGAALLGGIVLWYLSFFPSAFLLARRERQAGRSPAATRRVPRTRS